MLTQKQNIEVETTRQLRDKFCENGALTIEQWVLLVTTTLTLIMSAINNLSIRKLPVKNLIGSISRKDIERKKELNAILKEMSIISLANRVVLGRFRNSTSWGSDPYNFMDISDEYTNTTSIKDQCQNIIASKIYEQIDKCKEDDFTYFHRNSPGLSKKCTQYMDRNDINLTISRLIVIQNRIIGILECQFCREMPNDFQLDEARKKQLEQCFGKLTVILKNIVTEKN